MLKEKKITKFSVGIFTDGLYVIRGVIVEGMVCGVVIKTMVSDLCDKGTYVEFYEYYNKKDSFRRFKKVKGFFSYIFSFQKHNVITENIIEFITEISDLSKCAWNHKHIINLEKRNVLTEKFLEKNILLNYKSLTPESELKLVSLICNKYNYGAFKIINEFYISEEKKGDDLDIYGYSCTVKIYSIHNKNLFIDLKTFRAMENLYQILINGISYSIKSL